MVNIELNGVRVSIYLCSSTKGEGGHIGSSADSVGVGVSYLCPSTKGEGRHTASSADPVGVVSVSA